MSDRTAEWGRGHHRSPRTRERPMAFTAWELIRGVLVALGIFLAAAPLGYAITSLVGATQHPTHPAAGGAMGGSSMSFGPIGDSIAVWLVSIVEMAVFAIPATLALGIPLGWLLGWATARGPSWSLHLAVFAGLGLAVGAAITAVAVLGFRVGIPPGPAGWLIPVLATAVASAFGWWRTMAWAVLQDDWMDRSPMDPTQPVDAGQPAGAAMSPVDGSERSIA